MNKILIHFRPTRRGLAAAIGAMSLTLSATAARAADWPQYRGPNHDGTTADTVSSKWPASGPKELWRVKVGPGLGSFAVAGDGAYLFVAKDGKDTCVKLDAATGKEKWAAVVDDRTSSDKEGNGGKMPRSTPAVDGDKVYLLTTYLKLICLNAADGSVAWKHDLMSEFEGRNITWDNAASPVVDGDKVFVAGGGAGQSLLAFDKKTGSVAWKTGDVKITHASPTVATIGGVRQVIFFTQSGLVAVGADTGNELWRFPFPYHVSTASSPIVGGKNNDIVYCSAGYGSGTGACKVTKSGDKFTAAELWFAKDPGKKGAFVVNHWTTPVYKDGYIYGIYGFKDWINSPLKCVDITTGKDVWSEAGFGSGGGTVLAGNDLVVQSDTGWIVLVEATPKGYHKLAAVEALHPQKPYDTSVQERCWTMAVVAGGRIYARSTSEAVCLDVAGK